MKRNGIIGAGNWLLDKVKQLDRFPAEGELAVILHEQPATGGGPANVLFDLAVMDPAIPLWACGLVGEDNDGKFILDAIAAHKIDATYMSTTNQAATSYTDVMSAAGRRTFFHCAGANDLFGYEDAVKADVPAKLFYLGYPLLLAALDAEEKEFGTVGAKVLHEMRKRGLQTVVDVVSAAAEKFHRVIPSLLPEIDFLVVNEVEAGNFYGQPVRINGVLDCEKLIAAGKALLNGGVSELVTIHFPEGALALAKNGELVYEPSCDILRSEIAGSVGAGDAFCAGMVYSIHEGLPIREALKIASGSAYFNLLSPTSTGGAVPLAKIREHLKDCNWSDIPAYFTK